MSVVPREAKKTLRIYSMVSTTQDECPDASCPLAGVTDRKLISTENCRNHELASFNRWRILHPELGGFGYVIEESPWPGGDCCGVKKRIVTWYATEVKSEEKS